jgi:hypothetical protein
MNMILTHITACHVITVNAFAGLDMLPDPVKLCNEQRGPSSVVVEGSEAYTSVLHFVTLLYGGLLHGVATDLLPARLRDARRGAARCTAQASIRVNKCWSNAARSMSGQRLYRLVINRTYSG